MRYAKVIEQSDTGMVIARVFCLDTMNRVGLAFFNWPPFSQKRRLMRAHAWADKWISNCEAYCVDVVQIDEKGAGNG